MIRAKQNRAASRSTQPRTRAQQHESEIDGEILGDIDAQQIAALRVRLLAWFHKFQRDLPWRRNKDPYRIWLSEIMLQQTRVAAVIPFYERFLEHFPTIRALAAAPEAEVLRLWAGLGYYSRARNLQRAAQEIVEKHGGEFPRSAEHALALPGIGSYTAAAILSIAFGAHHAVLDGNVARVIARLGAVHGDLREGARWQALQATADALLDPDAPSDWNQAMMELGAMVCTPKAPQCRLCPVAEFCLARQRGLTEAIPEKRKKRATEEVELAAAVFIDKQGRTLLLPPPETGRDHVTQDEVRPLISKMWHFPMIAVQRDAAGELAEFLRSFDALNANGSKSKAAKVPKLEELRSARHTVTYRAIRLRPFRIAVAKLPRIAETKAVLLADLVSRSKVAVSNLTRKIGQSAETHADHAESRPVRRPRS
ncbi:MAG TPA: A/G-specific adenine glycosylase [Candidatus Acidoferrum sp.]|jgi:A/G-specific adenine glycosylase